MNPLRVPLLNAREKLRLYRAKHGGEYVGGVEYRMLMEQIETALRLDDHQQKQRSRQPNPTLSGGNWYSTGQPVPYRDPHWKREGEE